MNFMQQLRLPSQFYVLPILHGTSYFPSQRANTEETWRNKLAENASLELCLLGDDGGGGRWGER